ncbi:MAG TPA: undecaprenyl-diphosphate phosphatase [Acidimicrobiales bacterium]|nr:undecaprenyl-diphosphate phosphatase [Acidimicrobiales bacterium]
MPFPFAGAAPAATEGIPVLHAIVLGIVQGLTEFLPVSSSGHLILVPWLFGWNELNADPNLKKTFDVALHIGTFVGAAAYFAPDLKRFARAGLHSIATRSVATTDERMAWLLLLSAIPGAAAGAAFEGFIERELGQEWLIAVMLIAFGIVLAVADRARGKRQADAFGVRDAALMGMAQALALSPGVSRSGATITAGRWLGFERDAAARISFLMSLPIIGGAAAYRGAQVLFGDGLPAGTHGAFAAGIVASGVTGAAAVWGTLRFVRRRSFGPFVVYRVAAGAVVLGLLATGLR